MTQCHVIQLTTLKPKTFGFKTFGRNTSGKILSDCLSTISDKTTFGHVNFQTKVKLATIIKNKEEKLYTQWFSLFLM